MRQPIIIHFQGVTTQRVNLGGGGHIDDVASMVFTSEVGQEFICMLHGSQSSMDDNRRHLLETAHEIAEQQSRNELRQWAAGRSSARPRTFHIDDRISPMDPPDDEDDDRVAAPMDGDPDMEDDNLPF